MRKLQNKTPVGEKLALSVPEMAELLGIGMNKAYELSRAEDFPSFKVGTKTIISAEGLREWVKAQAAGGVAV